MDEAERLHSPSQLGAELGLKAGMIRRYHLAYEAVTGEPLPRDPVNNGRLVSDRQLAVLAQAREAVRRTPTLSAEDAIRHVLGFATIPTVPVAPQADLLEAILREMQASHEREAARDRQIEALLESNERIHEQLRTLNSPSPSDDAAPTPTPGPLPPADPERIDQALAAQLRDQQPPPAVQEDDKTTEHPGDGMGADDGVLVRVARWVESRLGRGRQR
jgi:hypothetical protein